MALPASGQISFQDFNTDRGLSSTATVDIDTAAIAYGIPTKPHGMNEFYGLSIGPPPPPPPPPPPTYSYYIVTSCSGGGTSYIVRHTSTLTPNQSVTLSGIGGCWNIDSSTVGLQNYDVLNVYADCTACISVPPPPPPPPIALSITNGSVTCSSGGNFTSTLSGGSGTYTYVAIDTSQANVSNAIQGFSGTRTTPSGGSSHSWISLADGTYYTAVMDSNGTYSVQTTSVTVSCAGAPPPPPPPIIYTYVSLCGTGGANAGYIVGNYSPGTNLEDTTTNDCYISIGTTTSPTNSIMPHSFTANTCTCPSPPPPPPPPPTPPSVVVSFSTGCSGGQTYVNLSATTYNPTTTPSYSWLITLDGSTDFSNAANYISPQNNSGLANGSYYVAVYDNANGVYDTDCCTANQGCAPPPPPPPPPPPVCYTWNVFNYNAYETVTGTYTNCSGFGDSFSFTDYSGGSNNVGSICVQDGTTPSVTSGNGQASNSTNTC